jgi:hypothetical protein
VPVTLSNAKKRQIAVVFFQDTLLVNKDINFEGLQNTSA